MSGHSKWHNIQARKGKQDALRGNLFTKLGKAISITARAGGGDILSNFSLRLAVEKAKENNMPKENIERAIKRGTGELEGAQIEEIMYEAFGPGGVAILIKVLTDNKNRAISDIKHILSDNGGSMGGAGSVQWMFRLLGVVKISRARFLENKEEKELGLIESGAEDIIEDEEFVEVRTKTENFQKVLNRIKELGMEIAESGLEWVAKEKISVSDEVRAKLERLFGDLEANEDVDNYFTNAE